MTLSWPRMFTVFRRIAVVGTIRSGKTAFLTSLINHLVEHDPDQFPFGQRATIQDFRIHPVPRALGEPFNYEGYRDALARQGRWPRKTVDSSHFICSFIRTDWAFARCGLHFLDFPGERIADAAIAAMGSYADWSDHILRYIENQSDYRALAEEFLILQEQTGLQAAAVTAAYRRTLARFILKYKPLVSPSTFLLDPQGQTPKETTVEGLAAERCTGLAPSDNKGTDRQFAPLSPVARQRHPALVTAFARHYAEYRNAIVLPLFRFLQGCQRMIVLVDIPALLAGGVGMFNDNRQILSDLFDVLRQDTFLGRLLRAMLLSSLVPWARLERVAMVAAKMDMVHPSDRNKGRLLGLLTDMTRRFSRTIPNLDCEWFECSAVVSTRLGRLDHTLIGPLAQNNPERREMEFPVSELPDTWPAAWQPGEFRFYRVHPVVPQNAQLPPQQVGLDRIFDYITRE